MTREFSVVIERNVEEYYVASVLALRGCHTQAGSPDQLMERVREAIGPYLEVEADEAEHLDFVGVQRVAVEAYYHIRWGCCYSGGVGPRSRRSRKRRTRRDPSATAAVGGGLGMTGGWGGSKRRRCSRSW